MPLVPEVASQSPSPPLKAQARSAGEEKKEEKASEEDEGGRRAECWVGGSIKGAGKKTDWMCNLKRGTGEDRKRGV